MFYLLLLIHSAIAAYRDFDNSVIGTPLITCGSDYIKVEVETEKAFAGRIFVKGEFRNDECTRTYLNGKIVPNNRPDTGSQFSARNPNTRGRGSLEPTNELGGVQFEGKTWSHSDSELERNKFGALNGRTSEGVPDRDTDLATRNPQVAAGTIDNVSREKLPTKPSGWLDNLSKTRLNDSDLLDDRKEPKPGAWLHSSTKTPMWLEETDPPQQTGKTTNNPSTIKVQAGFGNSKNSGKTASSRTSEQNINGKQTTPFLKVYPSKQRVDDLPKYPGPQGFTKENCKQFCEPCVCPSEERSRRSTNRIELIVPVGSCNAKRDRLLNPPSLITSFVAVVSFHENFITKLDKSYLIKCAYTERNMPVSAELNVSHLQAADLSGRVGPPPCEYRIAGSDGTPIQNIRVGDLVRHEWVCDNAMKDIYRILVHDCYAEDESGENHKLIDEHGCTMDKYVLGTPQYSENELKANIEGYMFKFPDKSSMDFQCSIRFCTKEDKDCLAMTPPRCNLGNRRKKRQSLDSSMDSSMTLHSNQVIVLDADQDAPNEPVASALSGLLPLSEDGLCMSVGGFGILVSLSTFLTTISIAFIIGYVYLQRRSKDY